MHVPLRWMIPGALLSASACGNAGADHAPQPDAGLADAAPIVDAQSDATPPPKKTPRARLSPHQHRVLPSMRLAAIYFGDDSSGGSPSFDAMMTWLLTSGYWSLLQQYGVGAGQFVGSVVLAANDVFAPGQPPKALLTSEELDARIVALLRPEARDAGVDGGASPAIPPADAYVVFLPNGVNVSLDLTIADTGQTCSDVDGYHDSDASLAEPFAVIAPCAAGRSALTISRALADMATDPVRGNGWWSEADNHASGNGGEVGDVCNASISVENWTLAQLWSNADGDCEPTP